MLRHWGMSFIVFEIIQLDLKTWNFVFKCLCDPCLINSPNVEIVVDLYLNRVEQLSFPSIFHKCNPRGAGWGLSRTNGLTSLTTSRRPFQCQIALCNKINEPFSTNKTFWSKIYNSCLLSDHQSQSYRHGPQASQAAASDHAHYGLCFDPVSKEDWYGGVWCGEKQCQAVMGRVTEGKHGNLLFGSNSLRCLYRSWTLEHFVEL